MLLYVISICMVSLNSLAANVTIYPQKNLYDHSKMNPDNFVNDELDTAYILELMRKKKQEINTKRNKSDDLVLFDYKEVPKNIPAKKKLSKNVLSVISRELKKAPPLKKSKPKKISKTKKKKRKKYNYRPSNTSVQLFVNTFGKQDKAICANCEFIPDYSLNERFYSDNKGMIHFNKDFQEGSLIPGTIVGDGIPRTRLEIPIISKQLFHEVETFDLASLNTFLDNKKYVGRNSLLVIRLDENVLDADIDHKYEAKIYLDNKFKEVKINEDYEYIIFVGADPGNTMISYLGFDGELTDKIVFLVEDELYFEFNNSIIEKNQTMQLYESRLFAKKSVPLVLDEKKIKYFNTNKYFYHLENNTYQGLAYLAGSHSKSYLELKHLSDSIFFSMDKNYKLEVPEQEFIENVLNILEIRQLDGRCIVQLNLPEGLKVNRVQANGDSTRGPLPIEVIYLNSIGEFSTEPDSRLDKVFIISEGYGSITYNLNGFRSYKYAHKSYCSNGSYLVEQL